MESQLLRIAEKDKKNCFEIMDNIFSSSVTSDYTHMFMMLFCVRGFSVLRAFQNSPNLKLCSTMTK